MFRAGDEPIIVSELGRCLNWQLEAQFCQDHTKSDLGSAFLADNAEYLSTLLQWSGRNTTTVMICSIIRPLKLYSDDNDDTSNKMQIDVTASRYAC